MRSAVREDDDSTNDENSQQKDERRHMMDSTRLKATPRTPRYLSFLFWPKKKSLLPPFSLSSV